jgi:hypothetical protein
MLNAEEPSRSRHLLQLELEAALLPPPAAASPAAAPPLAAPPPPAVQALALPPVVLWEMPLCGSPTPIGYIYDATPNPDGGLLAAASALFQVVHDPCPDLAAYQQDLGGLATIIPVNCLPDHILSLGLELMEGLFASSPVDILGTLFMAAYLSSPPPINMTFAASPQGPWSSRDPFSASPLVGGVYFGRQPMGGVSQTQGLGVPNSRFGCPKLNVRHLWGAFLGCGL